MGVRLDGAEGGADFEAAISQLSATLDVHQQGEVGELGKSRHDVGPVAGKLLGRGKADGVQGKVTGQCLDARADAPAGHRIDVQRQLAWPALVKPMLHACELPPGPAAYSQTPVFSARSAWPEADVNA